MTKHIRDQSNLENIYLRAKFIFIWKSTNSYEISELNEKRNCLCRTKTLFNFLCMHMYLLYMYLCIDIKVAWFNNLIIQLPSQKNSFYKRKRDKISLQFTKFQYLNFLTIKNFWKLHADWFANRLRELT